MMLNQLCIEVEYMDYNKFDEFMHELSEQLGLNEILVENALEIRKHSGEFAYSFDYDTDNGEFESLITYTGSCIFVESDFKYACLEVCKIIESLLKNMGL